MERESIWITEALRYFLLPQAIYTTMAPSDSVAASLAFGKIELQSELL